MAIYSVIVVCRHFVTTLAPHVLPSIKYLCVVILHNSYSVSEKGDNRFANTFTTVFLKRTKGTWSHVFHTYNTAGYTEMLSQLK